MLQPCARRKVENEWGEELVTKPILALLGLLKEKGGECGSWRGLERDQRTYGECNWVKMEEVQTLAAGV